MTLTEMGEFMGNNSGEFVLILTVEKQTQVDANDASGRCKRIDIGTG